MYLWDASLRRRRKEQDADWVRGYATNRDAHIYVAQGQAGKHPKDPDYVVEQRKAQAKAARPKTKTDTMAQLQSLELLYPDRVQITDREGVGSSSSTDGGGIPAQRR